MQNRQNQKELIEQIYQEHYPYLLHLLSSLTKDKQLAEDIIQDVFAALLNKPDLAIDLRRVKNFLIKSAKNKLIDYYRKTKPSLYGDEELYSSYASGGNSFEKQLEVTEVLHDVFQQMPPYHRYLLLAKEYYGYSFQEIADLTGRSSNSVKTAVWRARKQFIRHCQTPNPSFAVGRGNTRDLSAVRV
jgi:RNA polymerase sigma-70 factor (ECF subfamily)